MLGLDYVKNFFGTISAFYNKNRVKSSYTHIVEESSFGDEASKSSKEKRSEEHLILLKGKSNSSQL